MANETCSHCDAPAEYQFMHTGPYYCEKHAKLMKALVGGGD